MNESQVKALLNTLNARYTYKITYAHTAMRVEVRDESGLVFRKMSCEPTFEFDIRQEVELCNERATEREALKQYNR